MAPVSRARPLSDDRSPSIHVDRVLGSIAAVRSVFSDCSNFHTLKATHNWLINADVSMQMGRLRVQLKDKRKTESRSGGSMIYVQCLGSTYTIERFNSLLPLLLLSSKTKRNLSDCRAAMFSRRVTQNAAHHVSSINGAPDSRGCPVPPRSGQLLLHRCTYSTNPASSNSNPIHSRRRSQAVP